MLHIQDLQSKLITAVALSLFLVMTGAVQWSSAAPRQEAITLNNAGVLALNKRDFKTAIANLKLALDTDPTYGVAAENLSIAYNNYGLTLNSNPEDALAQFHRAVFYNSGDQTAKENMEGVIRLMKKDPTSFNVRVAFGDQAAAQQDYIGAFIEYKQALSIKEDPAVTGKLKAIADKPELSRGWTSAGSEHKQPQKKDDKDSINRQVEAAMEAIKENPFSPQAHIDLGTAFQARGDLAQAEAEFRQALWFDKGNAKAKQLLEALHQKK